MGPHKKYPAQRTDKKMYRLHKSHWSRSHNLAGLSASMYRFQRNKFKFQIQWQKAIRTGFIERYVSDFFLRVKKSALGNGDYTNEWFCPTMFNALIYVVNVHINMMADRPTSFYI